MSRQLKHRNKRPEGRKRMGKVDKIRYGSHEEWLEIRKNSIGGSDAAAIMGMSQYGSAYTLWLEKTGQREPEDISDKEPVRLGHDLEDYVAHRFMKKTGKKVRRENSILVNEDIPYAHASVDRLVVGELAGLECKTTNALNIKRFKNGDFPAEYYAQCMHYLMVTGLPKWHLAVLVLGVDFLTFEIERDEEEITKLMRMEEAFWQHVLDRTPPPVSGLDCDTEAILDMRGGSVPGTIDLFGRESMLNELSRLKQQEKDIQRQQEAIKQQIMLDMGDYDSGRAGKWKVSWKEQSRSTFDYKRFAADNPGLNLNPYFKVTHTRPFKIYE